MVMLIINAVTEEMFEFWFVCQLAYRKTTFLKLCEGLVWSKEEPMKSLKPRFRSKNRKLFFTFGNTTFGLGGCSDIP